MAVKSVRLRNENLEILVPPTEKTYAVTTITVCNNSSTESSSFDMHVVASGDPVSAGQHDPNATKVINNLTLAPEETFTLDTEKIVLGEGDKIVFFSTLTLVETSFKNRVYKKYLRFRLKNINRQ